MSRTRTSRWGAVFTVALVLCLLVLSGCRPKDTLSDLKRVEQDGALTVGNDTTYAPFEFVDSENKPTGFDIELIAAVAEKKLGLSWMLSLLPGMALPRPPDHGSSRFYLCHDHHADREKEVSFSIPYYERTWV